MSVDVVRNPILIHPGISRGGSLAERLRAKTTKQLPLVLVHDGGGTAFSYFCIGPGLGRPLYGLDNPRMHQGGYWDGGIAAMAEHYVTLLDRAFPKGAEILLGGWSLGGAVSLQMAHILATRDSSGPQIRVQGIIMIDTFYQRGLADATPDEQAALRKAVEASGGPTLVRSASEMGSMELKPKVDLNLMHAGAMLLEWRRPEWEGSRRPPPTVLLRARDPVPPEILPPVVRDGPGGRSVFDSVRHEPLLGWAEYNELNGRFFVAEDEVSGSHLSVFDQEHIDELVQKITKATVLLESMPPDMVKN
ncbi:hypothetical protein MCOR25_009024 [Pyricularia grisea]|nr:hypothetical protein MCOR25_009024 [Pyricularia grisea]